MNRRVSHRAQAQDIYREMKRARSDGAGAPHPPPQPDLTAQVRALYEGSAVPVAEIARLAGVTERTIYKYARKCGWTPRYRWELPDAGDARGRRWRAGETFAAAKGAGGRFVVHADKHQPVPAGIAATDPARAARAHKACVEAAEFGSAAEAEAQAAQDHESLVRAIDAVSRAVADFVRFSDRNQGARRIPIDARIERTLLSVVAMHLSRWQSLQAEA